MQVGDNGVISFGKPFLFYQPQQFPSINANIRNSFVAAPFWADVDNRKSGKITYQVYDAINQNAIPMINNVSQYVSEVVNENFAGLWMLLVEWRDVHPFPHGEIDETNAHFSFANKVSYKANAHINYSLHHIYLAIENNDNYIHLL